MKTFTALCVTLLTEVRIVAMAGMLLLAAVATPPAEAQGVYTPIQPAMSGLWYDTGAVGEGATLVVTDSPAGRSVFGIVYEGRRCDAGACTPGWLYFQGTPTHGATTLPLYATNALTFNTNSLPLPADVVGTITLRPEGCGAVYAEVNTTGPLVARHWVPLHYEQGGGTCYTCPGVDVSPPWPGCNY